MKSLQSNNNHGILLTMLLQLMLLASCTATLYVAPRQADCAGMSDERCFLIRNTPEGNWILHNEKITGFDYEPGFRYTLKVKREHVKHPPLGGASMKYVLVDIVEKKDVTDDMEQEDLINKEWKLEYLSQDGTETNIEGTVPTLTFSDDGKINGNGGCNTYFGSYKLTGRTIRCGDIGSTKMICEEGSEMESAYLGVLALELRGLFSEGKLILSADHGNRLIFGYQ